MRYSSIDFLRAITMLFMIWVNDFWTLINIPKWLKHANSSEDYLGFSDIIFPLFLFIVGLSIPLAIKKRIDQGQSNNSNLKHIMNRSFSLIIIGVFMVNTENAHNESIIIGTIYWKLLMAFGIALIWIDWKKTPIKNYLHRFLKITGLLVLVFIALIYKGGVNGSLWMTTQWWGILGLIGWAYLLNAVVYLYSKNSLFIMFLLWLLLISLNIINHSEMGIEFNGFSKYFSTILTGNIPAFTTAGIVGIMFLEKFKNKSIKWSYLSLIILGVINLFSGLVTRPIWGISKIQGTPSWLLICSGIGFLLFTLFYFISNQKIHTNWFKIIAPAGTATLTCYLIPYFIYPIVEIIGIKAPEFLITNVIGLITSFLFALLVVILTGWFEKKGFKLKL
ncbi:heparan-alpha-glucosaminide N-acetyltransferase domain-containing protein [Flavobacteriaceae bacterium]|nr:heparan-alpha-glucosaminide N-acetyltransferase domain-containing protein [Flavobacteriaceae bacterium]